MTLRNETEKPKVINEQKTIIETQPHLTISSLEFGEADMTAHLSDSRSITIPTAWFPRLRKATAEQLKHYEISPSGCAIHWPELDEDISIKSFINGLKGGCCC